jgi:hypothetical protein
MSKPSIAFLSGLLALAAVLGAVAVTRTVNNGRHAADAVVVARTKQLDRLEASLAKALAAKPAKHAAPRIVYHRPPPIVVVRHVRHGDDGGEVGDD